MSSFSGAQSYENNSSVQMKFGRALIQKLSLMKGWQVLDIGCGTGSLTEVLAKEVGEGGKVVAIDPDKDRLKIARDRHLADNIVYQEGVAEHLPEGEYDLIFSNFVLHWVEDKLSTFKQASKLLRKGGMFGLTVTVEFDIGEYFFPESEKLVSDEFRSYLLGHLHLLKTEHLPEYASNCDFEIQYLDIKAATFVFDDVNGLIKFYMTHGLGDTFTRNHFNVEAIEKFYKGNFTLVIPTAEMILKKQ